MAVHYVDTIKKFIKEKGLQDLSSEGWSRMRQAERELGDGKITLDDAIKRFLSERNFSYTLDRHQIDDLKKMFK